MVVQVLHRLRIFAKLSGVKINVDKSKLLLKGDLSPADYRDTQLLIVSKLKYLGVWIGHITTEQAFVECLAIALKRAQLLRKLPLGLNERVLILKIWILPLLNFTARAYQPNDLVISQLRNIYWVGLKLAQIPAPLLPNSLRHFSHHQTRQQLAQTSDPHRSQNKRKGWLLNICHNVCNHCKPTEFCHKLLQCCHGYQIEIASWYYLALLC